MKKILLIPILFVTVILNAQVDYLKQNTLLLSAYRAKEDNDYKTALSLYNDAHQIKKLNSISEYLFAAVCAAEMTNNASCENWIKLSIIDENTSPESILSFSKNDIYQDSAIKTLANYAELSHLFFSKKKNLYVYNDVQKLVYRDQFSRKLSNYHLGISEEDQEAAFNGYLEAQKVKDTIALKKYKALLYPKVSKEHNAYKDKIMRYTDSLNIIRLIDITKTHGWQEEAYILLWHQRGSYGKDTWIWSYFKPLINMEIKAGTIAPHFWAMLDDFKSIMEHKKSVYGYHPGKVNKDTVNLERKTIGLPELTIEEIAERNKNPYGGRMY
jgi:hypothetical protein